MNKWRWISIEHYEREGRIAPRWLRMGRARKQVEWVCLSIFYVDVTGELFEYLKMVLPNWSREYGKLLCLIGCESSACWTWIFFFFATCWWNFWPPHSFSPVVLANTELGIKSLTFVEHLLPQSVLNLMKSCCRVEWYR